MPLSPSSRNQSSVLFTCSSLITELSHKTKRSAFLFLNVLFWMIFMNVTCQGQALAFSAKRSSCGAIWLEHNLLLERSPRWLKRKRVSWNHVLSFSWVLFVFLSNSSFPRASLALWTAVDDAVNRASFTTRSKPGCATDTEPADVFVALHRVNLLGF